MSHRFQGVEICTEVTDDGCWLNDRRTDRKSHIVAMRATLDARRCEPLYFGNCKPRREWMSAMQCCCSVHAIERLTRSKSASRTPTWPLSKISITSLLTETTANYIRWLTGIQQTPTADELRKSGIHSSFDCLRNKLDLGSFSVTRGWRYRGEFQFLQQQHDDGWFRLCFSGNVDCWNDALHILATEWRVWSASSVLDQASTGPPGRVLDSLMGRNPSE